VTAVAMLRFICEHIAALPLSVMTRVLDTHDVLLGLVPLIENPPWTRRLDTVSFLEKLLYFA
jgi:zinc finger MYND domain-containing protein 10